MNKLEAKIATAPMLWAPIGLQRSPINSVFLNGSIDLPAFVKWANETKEPAIVKLEFEGGKDDFLRIWINSVEMPGTRCLIVFPKGSIVFREDGYSANCKHLDTLLPLLAPFATPK